MLRDITIGQYYPGDSVIHRLDPRVKLMGALTFIISVFLFDSIPGFILVTLFMVACIRLSKVPFKFMVKGLNAGTFKLSDHRNIHDDIDHYTNPSDGWDGNGIAVLKSG